MAKQGSGSRMRTKERRKKERRNKKENMQLQYQQWAAEGRNQKKGRSGTKVVKTGPRKRRVDSGNMGCLASNPQNLESLIRFKLLELAGYKKQWSSRYGKEVSQAIRTRWNNLYEAWHAFGIKPIRMELPASYA